MYFQQFLVFQLSVYIETDNQKDENKQMFDKILSFHTK